MVLRWIFLWLFHCNGLWTRWWDVNHIRTHNLMGIKNPPEAFVLDRADCSCPSHCNYLILFVNFTLLQCYTTPIRSDGESCCWQRSLFGGWFSWNILLLPHPLTSPGRKIHSVHLCLCGWVWTPVRAFPSPQSSPWCSICTLKCSRDALWRLDELCVCFYPPPPHPEDALCSCLLTVSSLSLVFLRLFLPKQPRPLVLLRHRLVSHPIPSCAII